MEFSSQGSPGAADACRRVMLAMQGDVNPDIEDLRSLRVHCACSSGARVLSDMHMAVVFFSYCGRLVRAVRLRDCVGEEAPVDIDSLTPIVTVVMQILANFAAHKGDFSTELWKAAGEEGFQDIIELSRRTGRRGVLGAAVAALHNCICHCDDDTGETSVRLDSFVHNRKLCSHLLLSIPLPMQVAPTVPPSASDPALEWMHLLIQRVVHSGRLLAMAGTLAPRAHALAGQVWDSGAIMSTDVTATLTYEQLTLLHFVEDVLEDRHSVSRFLSPIVLSDIGGMAVYLSKYIVGALATFAGSISNFADLCSLPPATLGSLDTHIDSPSGPPELQDLLRAFKVVYLSPPSRVGELDPVNRKACADFVQKWEEFVHSKDELILIFAVIASCVSFCGNQECGFPIAKVKAAQSSLVCTGIVAAIVCCLPHRIELLSKDDSANVNKNNALLNDSKRQIARESLRCLANILYSCVDAQNELRIVHGLQIVLVNCTTDFNNPLSREWALLCVRNACADNLCNQSFIEEFKVKNVVQSEVLTEQGIDVSLDATTGKFSVEKINSKDDTA